MSSPGRAAPPRILLVDDEPDMVHATALRLRRAGDEVLTAFDGAAARLAERERPDLRHPRHPHAVEQRVRVRGRWEPERVPASILFLTGPDDPRRRARAS
jgi:DNA-binding response OmpR family regulator